VALPVYAWTGLSSVHPKYLEKACVAEQQEPLLQLAKLAKGRQARQGTINEKKTEAFCFKNVLACLAVLGVLGGLKRPWRASGPWRSWQVLPCNECLHHARFITLKQKMFSFTGC
jgi:hypothetical protein